MRTFDERPARRLFTALVVSLATAQAQTIPVSGDPIPGFEALDQSALALIQKYSIPGVTLGITKGGRLVFARGYGFADLESKTPVSPDSLFRLASVSKPLTATAVDKLVEQGKLTYDRKAFEVLRGLQPLPGAHEDPRIAAITVKQLAMHQSGWADDIGGNRYGDLIAAANALGLPLPGSFEGLIRYELGRPLDYDPGTQNHYCNFCYGVLAEVAQAASGQDYERLVIDVLRGVGISRTRIGRHLKSDRFPGEVTYYFEPSGTVLAPSVYAGLPSLVPIEYGGIVVDWGTGSAAGAWVSNTVELLRLVASVTLGASPAMFSAAPRTGWAFSGLPIGRGWVWRHDGGIPGTATTLHIEDDIAWCILTNTSYNGGPFINDFDQSITAFAQGSPNWPSGDLFPQYLPAVTKAVISVSAAAYAAALAPESIASAFGTGLATSAMPVTTLPLPTTFNGTTVKVKDSAGVERLAPLFYVGPTQVNYEIPAGTAAGQALVTITSGDGTVSIGTINVTTVAPACFRPTETDRAQRPGWRFM